jgi:hypothetical protein
MGLKLSYHGRSKEACEWVLDNFAGRVYYKDNGSVQEWITESKQWLSMMADDEEYDQALESKYGTIE